MRIQKLLATILTGTVLSFTGTLASANLIMNGSFESLPDGGSTYGYGKEHTWQIYDELPSWQATRTIEVWQDGFLGVNAPDGDQFIELNAHPKHGQEAFAISQGFATHSGSIYEVSFYARARNNPHEKFRVEVGTDLNQLIQDHVVGEWTQFIYTFVASSDWSVLSFKSEDKRWDTTGNLIDHVVVTKVPEPGTIALLAMGLVGLVLQRRHVAREVVRGK